MAVDRLELYHHRFNLMRRDAAPENAEETKAHLLGSGDECGKNGGCPAVFFFFLAIDPSKFDQFGGITWNYNVTCFEIICCASSK